MELRRELLLTIGALALLNLLLAFGSIGLFVRMGPAIERILQENVYSVVAAEKILVELSDGSAPPLDAESRAQILEALDDAKRNVTEEAERPVLGEIESSLPIAMNGDAGSAERAADFIEGCLHLSEFPAHAPHPQDLDLYHSVATVKVPEDVTLSFGEDSVDLWLVPELDHMNFRELIPHTFWGRVRAGCLRPLEVTDTAGNSAFDRYFTVSRGELRLARTVMPAMLTLDERAIRQDCLCYLMERMLLPPLA